MDQGWTGGGNRVFGGLQALWQAEAERLILWLPVLLGSGVALYFALAFEPPLIWSLLVGIGAGGLAYAGRTRIWLWLPLLMVALVAAGMALAGLRTAMVSAPILERSLRDVVVTGRLTAYDRTEQAYRIWLDTEEIAGLAASRTPARLRLILRSTPPEAGARVQLRAALLPPPTPSLPGDYDFARSAYFERIGAVGSVIGPVTLLEAAQPGRLAIWFEQAREAMRRSLEALLPRDVAGVAVALLTGERGGIGEADRLAIAQSGLAHLLAISGLHISLAVGVAYVTLRFLLALSERAALWWPTHKLAALAGMVMAIAYTLLVDAPVPAVRACISSLLILAAVLADRTAISMRLVAWAALAVLLVQPEAVVGASFQMSFAAVAALVATYESLGGRLRAWKAQAGPVGGVLANGGLLMLTSLVAGLATAPYTQFHFNQMVAYGLLANMIGVPLFGLWIMPLGLLGMLLLPLGLEAVAWVPMGWGVEVLLWVARWVAGLPGAALPLPAPPEWGLGLLSLGGIWLCLWMRPWRWLGLLAIVGGLATTLLSPRADLIVADDGALWAVRLPDGRLAFSEAKRGFDRDRWQQREGALGAGVFTDQSLAGAHCTQAACQWPSPAGPVLLWREAPAADACQAAAVIIAPRHTLGQACPNAMTIDRNDLRRAGTHLLYWQQGRPRLFTVADWRGQRPWS